jgi:hypothetical protein
MMASRIAAGGDSGPPSAWASGALAAGPGSAGGAKSAPASTALSGTSEGFSGAGTSSTAGGASAGGFASAGAASASCDLPVVAPRRHLDRPQLAEPHLLATLRWHLERRPLPAGGSRRLIGFGRQGCGVFCLGFGHRRARAPPRDPLPLLEPAPLQPQAVSRLQQTAGEFHTSLAMPRADAPLRLREPHSNISGDF